MADTTDETGALPIEYCRAGGGDHTEQVDCPRCGENVLNTQLADHLAGECE
jgi:ribosomal protein S27AE